LNHQFTRQRISAIFRTAATQRKVIWVLARLSRKRYCAGRIVALAYLLCVLAPSVAFAFGNAHLSEHCLFDDGFPAAPSHRADGASNEADVHSLNHQHAINHGGAAHHHHDSIQMADQSEPAPHDSHHVALDQQCCGMLCIAAMPVAVTEVATPSTLQGFLAPETERSLVESLPSQRYRPPIA
jgi:hypothetical protein